MKFKSFEVTKKDICRNDFINMYSNDYFYESERQTIVTGITRTRGWIEEDMERLLEGKNWTEENIVRMLAWKMGRIDYKRSTEENRYVFTGNNSWSDKQPFRANNRKGEINIGALAKNVLKLKKDYDAQESYYKKQPDELLSLLRKVLVVDKENSITGIGSVYLITILYFVSGGYYPIYDQFAMMALQALQKGALPGEKIKIRDLPAHNEDAFLAMLTKPSSQRKKSAYMEYIELLEKLFYDDNINFRNVNDGRRIDRALWVYGHLFNKA